MNDINHVERTNILIMKVQDILCRYTIPHIQELEVKKDYLNLIELVDKLEDKYKTKYGE